MASGKLILLLFTGLLLAALPLTSVWAARDGRRYHKLIAVSLFLTFDLIVFGAFTRLTDSGLGCPDWPGCYGHANPLQAHAEIAQAEQLMPDGPVTVMKAWIEMIHRFLAMAIGVLMICLAISSWRLWKRERLPHHHPGLSLSLLFAVCVQGAFGAWTVTLKLQPLIVTIHLILGMLLLAMLAWAWARQQDVPRQGSTGLRWLARAAWLILFVQIALGGWVSTNYAPLACLEYPTCQGAWVPPMDFEHGFTLWRELGKTAHGDFLPFAALTAIHWVHRNMALLVAAVLGVLIWRSWQVQPRLARLLLALLLLQMASGISTIFLKWPLVLALAHNAGAAALVLVLSVLNYRVSPTRG